MTSGGWDKLNEVTGGALPIKNASQANIDIRNQAMELGGGVVEVDHSRGSLTSSNATFNQINNGQNNLGLKSVTFYGAAAGAVRLAKALQKMDGGLAAVYQSTHVEDLIGRWIGGNAATGGVVGTSIGDAHSSYGPKIGVDDLRRYWGAVGNNAAIRVQIKKGQ